MSEFNDKQIIESWETNASPWINAIEKGQIESRILVTNTAIVEAVERSGAKSCLDIGCGEGWLVRELVKAGVTCVGIDVIPELIEYARKEGDGEFKVISYEDLSPGKIKKSFDVAVCNFSLLGNESVERVFEKVNLLLNGGGFFIVQTIHPIEGCGEFEYKDGWRKGSWAGFNSEFSNPAPWYFRTLETWKGLYIKNGFRIKEIIEPLVPKTQVPASIIFVGVKTADVSNTAHCQR